MQETLKGDMNILIPMVKASGLYYTHMLHFGWTPSEHHLSGLWKYSRGLHQECIIIFHLSFSHVHCKTFIKEVTRKNWEMIHGFLLLLS